MNLKCIIRHKMAKCQGSGYFTSKVTAFCWEVPTKIFVNLVEWDEFKIFEQEVYFGITNRYSLISI